MYGVRIISSIGVNSSVSTMKTVLLLLLFVPTILWAQVFKISPQDTQRKKSYIRTRDGLVVHGQVMRQDSTIITVKKRNGDLSFIEADQVLSITPNRPEGVSSTNPSGVVTTVFVLKDNVRLAGTFVRRDSTMITVRKNNRQLTYFEPELLVRVDTLRDGVEPLEAVPDGGLPNRFSPWLLTGQTAYNPDKGKLYYRNTLLVVNELHYGLTRNLSVGVNVNPFYGEFNQLGNLSRERLFGATVRLFSKLTFPIGKQFRFGVNAIYQPRQKGQLFQLDQQIVVQGLMSFGNTERNATLGYGLRFFPDYTNYTKSSYIRAGVMHKIGRTLTFLSDNTFYLNPFAYNGFYTDALAELSVALRLNRQRHSFDFGAVSTIQSRLYIDPGFGRSSPGTRAYFYPYIAYSLLIGRK